MKAPRYRRNGREAKKQENSREYTVHLCAPQDQRTRDGRTQESLRKANRPRSLNRRDPLSLPRSAPRGAGRVSRLKNRLGESMVASLAPHATISSYRVLCGRDDLIAVTSFRREAGTYRTGRRTQKKQREDRRYLKKTHRAGCVVSLV